MVAFANQPKLGYGIYTVADVATVLGLPLDQVRRWLKKYWDLKLAPDAGTRNSWGERKDKSVNFYAMVEFYVFYELRRHGVSISRIVKSHQLLREKFDTPYPFASYRIMTDGRAILFSPDGGASIVSANTNLQYELKEIIEDFIKKIDFGKDDQFALRLYPDGKRKNIVVDPHHQFGQPVVKGTNILASVLFSMFKGGESVDFIAEVYNLKKEQVKDAIQYYQKAA
ncbi:MAG: DUF433 domain-containing protein [Saprospiraceae bacterium]